MASSFDLAAWSFASLSLDGAGSYIQQRGVYKLRTLSIRPFSNLFAERVDGGLVSGDSSLQSLDVRVLVLGDQVEQTAENDFRLLHLRDLGEASLFHYCSEVGEVVLMPCDRLASLAQFLDIGS